MNVRLKISLAANVMLLGGLIFSRVANHPPGVAAPSVAVAPVTPPPLPGHPVAAPVAARVEPAPFRWQQLEAKDYHRYVKNLRDIGCPETSVRAIVTADVAAVYDRRRRTLERELSALADGSWSNRLAGAGSETTWRTELAAIPDEEPRLIADLLGLPAAAKPVETVPAADEPSPGVALPLVFQEIDPAALKLSADDQQTLENLRQNFIKEIGGTNQNLEDPAYLARWQAAQPKYDSLLQGMLGNEVYNQFQMLEYQKSADADAARQAGRN
jgi:hypothetical protein